MTESTPGSAATTCFAIFCADGLEVEHHNHCTMAWYHAGRWNDGGVLVRSRRPGTRSRSGSTPTRGGWGAMPDTPLGSAAAPLCVGDHGEDRPEAAFGLLCDECFRKLRSSLRETPAIATWLEVHLTAGGTELAEKVTGTSEDPIPLRLDVLDLVGPDSRHWVAYERPAFLLWDGSTCLAAYETWREAVQARWAQIIDSPDLDADVKRWQARAVDSGGCDQRGADSIRSTLFAWVRTVTEEEPEFTWPDAYDVATLAGWLAGHLSWIAARSWVDEMIGELRKVSADAHRLAPWREELMRTDDPCSSCSVRAVTLHVARSVMVCEKRLGGCGKSWSSPYLKQATG